MMQWDKKILENQTAGCICERSIKTKTHNINWNVLQESEVVEDYEHCPNSQSTVVILFILEQTHQVTDWPW